jgi:hypothetical protein
MGELDVSLVLLRAFFYCAACLADIDFPAFAHDLADTRNFQTQALLNQPENAVCLGWWKMYCFNVLPLQYLATVVAKISYKW